MIACPICRWNPLLLSGSTHEAATSSQLCQSCGCTLGTHAPDHPHPSAYCQGFQFEAWRVPTPGTAPGIDNTAAIEALDTWYATPPWPCANPTCDNLTEAVSRFCCTACAEAVR